MRPVHRAGWYVGCNLFSCRENALAGSSCAGAATQSGVTSQAHKARRQAGAIKPVRRAGWERAESLLQQQRDAWAGCTCAGARIRVFSRSLLRGIPQSCLPHAARRVPAHRSEMHGLGKRALCQSSSLKIQYAVSKTFTSCDKGLCPLVPMSLLDPRRLGELVLLYCLHSKIR